MTPSPSHVGLLSTVGVAEMETGLKQKKSVRLAVLLKVYCPSSFSIKHNKMIIF